MISPAEEIVVFDVILRDFGDIVRRMERRSEKPHEEEDYAEYLRSRARTGRETMAKSVLLFNAGKLNEATLELDGGRKSLIDLRL